MRVGHRGQAAAQGGRVELGGVGAPLLHLLAVHISRRLAVRFGFSSAGLFPKLPFALLAPRRGGFLRPGGRGAAVVVVLREAAGGGAGACAGATANAFEAGDGAATAGFIQAAAGAAVSHLLVLGLAVCLNFETVVSAKYSQPAKEQIIAVILLYLSHT